MKGYNLHLHSTFSDGELIPAELARRCAVLGYTAIAITDHVDNSNIDFVLSSLVNACGELSKQTGIEVIPGVELTHLPVGMIEKTAKKAKTLGARIVIVHGETLAEPVQKGTNRAAVELEEVDILAHPGLITKEEAELAKENDVYLEITARKGHCITNGHVSRMAQGSGAKLIVNTDAHAPEDLASPQDLFRVALGAGISNKNSRIITSVNPRSLLRYI